MNRKRKQSSRMSHHYDRLPTKIRLRMMFDHIEENVIDEVIDMVQEQDGLNEEEQFERMINYLVETGDSTSRTNQFQSGSTPSKFRKHYRNGQVMASMESLPSTSSSAEMGGERKLHESELYCIQDVFRDICPDFLNEFCRSMGTNFNIEDAIEALSAMDYKKIGIDPNDLAVRLQDMFPMADPDFLREKAVYLAKRPENELQLFIQRSVENNDLPTRQEYMANKRIADEISSYSTNFSPEKFLEKFPKPHEHFLSTTYKSVLPHTNNTITTGSSNDTEYARVFLFNRFTFLRKRDINIALRIHKYDLIKTFARLEQLPAAFWKPRKQMVSPMQCTNIPLLQEIAFLKYKRILRHILKQKDDTYRLALQEAERFNLLQICHCCYDDHLLPEECLMCQRDCTFCRECVKKSAEIVWSQGDIKFPCLTDCKAEFSLCTLQLVFDERIFHRLCQRIQIEELRLANIEGIETCPFCDFSMIPLDQDKIFRCANDECLKESCRLCRHEAHIPLKCNEVEYEADVKMRTYIEDQMTDALVRKCPTCFKSFYKTSGCSKVTCMCGTTMCYVCGAKNISYQHFRDSNPLSSCDMWIWNHDEFHTKRVIHAADRAKNELGISTGENILKFDPTVNFQSGVFTVRYQTAQPTADQTQNSRRKMRKTRNFHTNRCDHNCSATITPNIDRFRTENHQLFS